MLHGLYIRHMLPTFKSQDTKTKDTALPQWAVNPRLTGTVVDSNSIVQFKAIKVS